nr:MAG: putative RNA dependent RNA polymerase [Enontekio alphapartitivirus 2]
MSGSAELPYVTDDDAKEYIIKRFEANEIQNRRLTKGNLMNYMLIKERSKIHNIKEGVQGLSSLHYVKVHVRSHLSTRDKNKVRVVLGVPYTLLLVEMMLLSSLTNHIYRNCDFVGWGYETFKGGLKKLRDKFGNYTAYLSLDFSAFDKRIPHWMIRDIHSIWNSSIDNSRYYVDDPRYPDSNANPDRTQRLWNFMYEGVTQCTYLMPDGSKWKYEHSGFGSGLYQTQLLGSCANFVMITSALLSIGFTADEFKIVVLGDDSLICLNYEGNLKMLLLQITTFCKNNFNALINVEKSVFYNSSEHLQFLSYKYVNGVVTRVRKDLLARLLFPENGKYSAGTTKSRALGIMMSNLGDDLEVHDVCRRILDELKDVPYDEEEQDWFDKIKLDFALKKFEGSIPTRDDLMRLANTIPEDIYVDNVFDYLFK